MLREDGQQLTGAPHSRGGGWVGHAGARRGRPFAARPSDSRSRWCSKRAPQPIRQTDGGSRKKALPVGEYNDSVNDVQSEAGLVSIPLYIRGLHPNAGSP